MTYKDFERFYELEYLTSEFNNEELLKEYNWYLKLIKGVIN